MVLSEGDAKFDLQGLDVKVWRKYENFVEELSERFPHEREGIKKFYGECWAVFNSLNSLELKSLEEPRYLLGGRHLFLDQTGPGLSLVMHISLQLFMNAASLPTGCMVSKCCRDAGLGLLSIALHHRLPTLLLH